MKIEFCRNLCGVVARRIGAEANDGIARIAHGDGVKHDAVGICRENGSVVHECLLRSTAVEECDSHGRISCRTGVYQEFAVVGPYESAADIRSERFLHIHPLHALVAGRADEDASRSEHLVDDVGVEGSLVEFVLRPFAHVDDTRLANAPGIVEDVFEGENVCRRGVFVEVFRLDECLVLPHHVRHETEVGVGSHADVWREGAVALAAAACRNAGGVRAVAYDMCVGRACLGAEGGGGGVLPAYIDGVRHAVRRLAHNGFATVCAVELVPQAADAAFRAVGGEEGGVVEVEANIHHAYDNALARQTLTDNRQRRRRRRDSGQRLVPQLG